MNIQICLSVFMKIIMNKVLVTIPAQIAFLFGKLFEWLGLKVGVYTFSLMRKCKVIFSNSSIILLP